MSLSDVCAAETMREIAGVLPFRQLYVVWMRRQGYSNSDIARQLGVCRMTIGNWLKDAQRQVVAAFPELEAEAGARHIPTRTPDREPYDWEWIY